MNDNLLLMKHELIHFYLIVTNLIFHKLLINYLNLIEELINYLNLIEESIKKQLLTAVLQLFEKIKSSRQQMFFKIRCSQKFCNIHRKTPVLEFLFNKIAGLQLSCEYCNVFNNSFFHKTPSVAASEKFINFPGKHQ